MKQKRRHYSADEKAKISVVGQFPVTAFTTGPLNDGGALHTFVRSFQGS
jgi:hypothetical protein